MATYGPFTITVDANRAVIINGKTYVKDQTVVLQASEVGPEIPRLIEEGYVSSDPAMPTGAAFTAMVNSSLDADPGFPYLGSTLAPSIDELVNDASTYDYVHGLNSLHVGVVGRVERVVNGGTVEILLAPFGKSTTMDVKFKIVDDNTIRLYNDTGSGHKARFRLQAYKLG